MSLSRLQIPYMTTAERMAIVPNDKDVLLDTDEMIIYVGDGSTLGGINACRQDLSGLQLKFIRTTATLLQTSWTEGATFWEYEYSNVNIATTSDVTVTPTSEIEAVKAADIQPHVVEGAGKVTIYAVNQPTVDIAVEIKIWK